MPIKMLPVLAVPREKVSRRNMSILSNNKKFIYLEKVRAHHEPRTDSIHLTSADDDLIGLPFHVGLKKFSETERTVRSLLSLNRGSAGVSKIFDTVELHDVKIFYSMKEDSVQIISYDERIVGSPFHITLSRYSCSALSLKRLMLDVGIIKPKRIVRADSDLVNVPKYSFGGPRAIVTVPNYRGGSFSSTSLGLGSKEGSYMQSWHASDNLLVLGSSGAGKTVMLSNIFADCVLSANTEVYTIAGKAEDRFYGREEFSGKVVKHLNFETFGTGDGDVAVLLSMLEELNKEVLRRKNVEHEEKSRLSRIVFLWDFAEILSCDDSSGDWDRVRHLFASILEHSQRAKVTVVCSTNDIDTFSSESLFKSDVNKFFTARFLLRHFAREDAAAFMFGPEFVDDCVNYESGTVKGWMNTPRTGKRTENDVVEVLPYVPLADSLDAFWVFKNEVEKSG